MGKDSFCLRRSLSVCHRVQQVFERCVARMLETIGVIGGHAMVLIIASSFVSRRRRRIRWFAKRTWEEWWWSANHNAAKANIGGVIPESLLRRPSMPQSLFERFADPVTQTRGGSVDFFQTFSQRPYYELIFT